MSFDPDFVITIDGFDVTREVMNWKLTQVDDGISNIVVKLANHDHLLSGVFSMGSELSIVFGYQDNLGEQIQMTIKGVKEDYSLGASMITITAKDCLHEMNETCVQGHGKDGAKPKDLVKDLGKQANIDIDVQMEDPKDWSGTWRHPFTGKSMGMSVLELGAGMWSKRYNTE